VQASFSETWDSINIYDGPEVFLRTFASANPSAALLYAAHFAQSEICNGGFDQFFWNSTGVLASEAIAGFQAIGMSKTAALVQNAVDLFGGLYPRERKIRQEQLKAIDQGALDELDQKFFALIKSENGGFQIAAKTFLPDY
jgi:hypothetical protein